MASITDLHNDCMDVFAYFFGKCVDAMVTSSRISLELLKKKMQMNELHFTKCQSVWTRIIFVLLQFSDYNNRDATGYTRVCGQSNNRGATEIV